MSITRSGLKANKQKIIQLEGVRNQRCLNAGVKTKFKPHYFVKAEHLRCIPGEVQFALDGPGTEDTEKVITFIINLELNLASKILA